MAALVVEQPLFHIGSQVRTNSGIGGFLSLTDRNIQAGRIVDYLWHIHVGWLYQVVDKHSVDWIQEGKLENILNIGELPAFVQFLNRHDIEGKLKNRIAGELVVQSKRDGDDLIVMLERPWQMVVYASGPTKNGFGHTSLMVNSIGVQYTLPNHNKFVYQSDFLAGLLYGQATQLIGIEPKAALEGKI